MLRITAKDNPRTLIFRLEGRLEGPWVRELEQCWHSMLTSPNPPAVRVDLTGVTYIDAAGKARLAQMQEQGAELIAGDCVTKAVVAEIAEEMSIARSSNGKENQNDTTARESNPTDQRKADHSRTPGRRVGSVRRQRSH